MRARPIGTLIQKIDCHDRPCTTAPPTSGPVAIASPATPPQMPRAIPRRSTGTAAARSVRGGGGEKRRVRGPPPARPAPGGGGEAPQPVGARRECSRGGAEGEHGEADH